MSCAHLLDHGKFDIGDHVCVHGGLLLCAQSHDLETFSKIMKKLEGLSCSKIRQVLFYKPYDQWFGNLLHSLFTIDNPSGKCFPEDLPTNTTRTDTSMVRYDGLVRYHIPHSYEFRAKFNEVTKQMARLVLNLARVHGLSIEILNDRDYYNKIPIISGGSSPFYYFNNSALSGFTKFINIYKMYQKRMKKHRIIHQTFMKDLRQEILESSLTPPGIYPLFPKGGQLYLESLERFTTLLQAFQTTLLIKEYTPK
jgi:hypothetical protein